MDHFENIAKTLLEREGYWVMQSYKVDLSKEQKREISEKKATIPRPEIDLLALNVANSEVIAFEVKSYFDSTGIVLKHFTTEYEIPEGKYKLFTCERYKDIVLGQLRMQLIQNGFIKPEFTIRLGLIAGNGRKSEISKIAELFAKRNWEFWSPESVKVKVQNFAKEGYENDPAVITTKILQR